MYFDSIKAATSIIKASNDLDIDLDEQMENSSFADEKHELIVNLIGGLEGYKKHEQFNYMGEPMFIFTSACYYLINGFDIPNEDAIDTSIAMADDDGIPETSFFEYFGSNYKKVFSYDEENIFDFDDSEDSFISIDLPPTSPDGFKESIALHLNYLQTKGRAIVVFDYYDFAFYNVITYIGLFTNQAQIKPNRRMVDKLIDYTFTALGSFNIQITKEILSEMIYSNLNNPYVPLLKEKYYNYLYEETD